MIGSLLKLDGKLTIDDQSKELSAWSTLGKGLCKRQNGMKSTASGCISLGSAIRNHKKIEY